MEGKKNKIEPIIRIVLIILFAVGLVGHGINYFRELMLVLTPYVLLLSSLLVLYPVIKPGKNTKNILWFCFMFVITFVLEVAGVKTGFVFGEYYYGGILGTKIFEVPLIIGINWVLILAGAILLSKKISKNIFVVFFLTGFFALLFDLFLEPVAIRLGYWSWAGDNIPLQNYAAWFFIGGFSSLLYLLLKAEVNSKIITDYYFIQLIFFLVLNFIL